MDDAFNQVSPLELLISSYANSAPPPLTRALQSTKLMADAPVLTDQLASDRVRLFTEYLDPGEVGEVSKRRCTELTLGPTKLPRCYLLNAK